jgi:hypothetical protein
VDEVLWHKPGMNARAACSASGLGCTIQDSVFVSNNKFRVLAVVILPCLKQCLGVYCFCF